MILFLDLETTGLTPHNHCILELGALAIDDNQRVIHTYETLVAPVPHAKCHPVVQMMHTDNGLWDAIATYPTKTIDQVDNDMRKNLELWAPQDEPIHLAGDSIHFDRKFIAHHMPLLDERLHHRMVDVSSFGIVFERLNLPLPEKKETAHRAYADALDSLRKYKHYMRYMK